MATSSPWPLIHAEREALADDLEKLTNAQWATPSLCTGWTVRDVLGHLTATAKITPLSFLTGLAGTGFKFNALSEKNIAREATPVPADGLAEFRRHLNDTTHPPGPAEAMLGEAVVHGEDIRRPLGIVREYPVEAVTRAANFFSRSNLLIGSKRRIEGVTLRATDADWQHGSGPEVTGPLLSLLLAMTGRSAALADLTGEAAGTLRERTGPGSS
jgi:uncharacterized protein (TIGR03083 family)